MKDLIRICKRIPVPDDLTSKVKDDTFRYPKNSKDSRLSHFKYMKAYLVKQLVA